MRCPKLKCPPEATPTQTPRPTSFRLSPTRKPDPATEPTPATAPTLPTPTIPIPALPSPTLIELPAGGALSGGTIGVDSTSGSDPMPDMAGTQPD